MKSGIKRNASSLEKALFRLIFLGAALLTAGVGNAALITGSMGLTGGYDTTDLSTATTLSLLNVTGTSGDGDLGVTVDFGTGGTVNNGLITFDPSTPVTNLLKIGGWQVDLGTIAIVDQTVDILTLSGTGAVSGDGFDLTPTTWSLSANADGSTYSMTINAVPVPAAVWLFGSGLIGLVALARRKTA